MKALDLTGLTTLPSQAWGGVRLVPLVREEPIADLRLHARIYEDEYAVVQVKPRMSYFSYVPHGFVASWTNDGTPAAAYGTQLGQPGDRTLGRLPACVPLRFQRRMAKRVDKNRLRFLPLHLALEGYLALHFGGPPVVWEEWSHRAISRGLSPRVEEAYVGAAVRGLQDALRVFEIHPNQCGVLLYVADALAGALVVPHPDDYRSLHPTLVHDLYGELIYHYALLYTSVPDFRATIDDTRVRSVADLRAEAGRRQGEWAAFHDRVMAGGLLDTDYTTDLVYRMGRFSLWRFLPPFHRQRENHIGEIITDADGRLAYLKTFRLSENQVRRGHLLSRLAAHDWHLESTAAAMSVTPAQLALRIEGAGFGALLRKDVLDHYRAQARRGTDAPA